MILTRRRESRVLSQNSSSTKTVSSLSVKRTIELSELKPACGVTRVEVDDPYYGRRKSFWACPLGRVLALRQALTSLAHGALNRFGLSEFD